MKLTLLILSGLALMLPGSLTATDTDTDYENAYIVQYLNEATPEELEAVKGIGPVTAQRIIELRPYAEITEVLNVKGIGPVKASAIYIFAVTVWEDDETGEE